MSKIVADLVFKSELGNYFNANNPELIIEEFEYMYKITRKPKAPATSNGATVYISKNNGTVLELVK